MQFSRTLALPERPVSGSKKPYSGIQWYRFVWDWPLRHSRWVRSLAARRMTGLRRKSWSGEG